jgi:hypothetical protein
MLLHTHCDHALTQPLLDGLIALPLFWSIWPSALVHATALTEPARSGVSYILALLLGFQTNAVDF